MTVELYANYGELAHEYTPVYAYTPNYAHDNVTVDVPDKYNLAERYLYGTIRDGYSVEIPVLGGVTTMELCEALNYVPFFQKACKITVVK